MRNTIISRILFLTVLGFVAYANHSLSELCEDITDCSDEIEMLLDNNHFEDAYLLSLEILQQVKDAHKLSSMYVNHTDYDYIANEAEKLTLYIREKDISESYVSVHMLKSTAHNIGHLHKPSLENIF